MRRVLSAWLAATFALGCQAGPPAGAPASARPTARPSGTSAAAKAAATGLALPAWPPEARFRAIPQVGSPVTLTGKVRLISDLGGGLVTDNGAGVISNNGSGVVSNGGAGLTGKVRGDAAAGLTGKVRYRTAQAAAGASPASSAPASVREVLLAEAAVELLDAEGRVLTDAENRPLVAVTDRTGGYRFEGVLPAENLVVRVRLFPNGAPVSGAEPAGAAATGQELLALLARDAFTPASAAAEAPALDLDTASTLGAAYVLEKYVQQRQAVYDKLPAREAAALRTDVLAARDRLPPGPPSYRRAELVKTTEALRAVAPAVNARLETIRALLLAGQAGLGEGRLATEVALMAPMAVGGDGAGGLYVIEAIGRARHVGPDGRISNVRTHGAPAGSLLGALHGSIVDPDGAIVYTEPVTHAVYRVAPDGAVTRIAGTGVRGQGAAGSPPLETELMGPAGLTRGPDGALYVGEAPRQRFKTGRILRIAKDGPVEAITIPATNPTLGIAALAFTPDGALWALDGDAEAALWRRGPEGTWARVAAGLGVSLDSRMIALADDGVLVSETTGHALTRFGKDGARTRMAGTGRSGFSPDGTPAGAAAFNRPAGMWLAPDGTLYLTERGNQLVRRIADFLGGAGVVATVAGTRGVTQQGDALAVAVNGPSGIALDPQGRIVIAETGSHTLKRLGSAGLELVAGDPAGHGYVEGPAATARFASPAGLAFAGERCYVVDGENHVIRMIDFGRPDAPVTTVAGARIGLGQFGVRQPAAEAAIGRALMLAVAPDGRPYWSVNDRNNVQRLNPDGTVEVVVGSPSAAGGHAGDGGPAAEALLRSPIGLAFDAHGDLYVADAGNACVRKITGLAGAQPRIETVAGLGDALASLAASQAGAGEPAASDGKPAREVPLAMPGALCLDAAGNLYVGELGSYFLGALAGEAIGALLAGTPPMPARIRKVTPDGRIFAIAGEGTPLLADPGGDDGLISPGGILIDREGRLVVADSAGNQLKVLPLGSF